MKTSVIVPTLNSQYFLEETLRSIFGQQHTDREVIIVDGGSTDGTLHIAGRYPIDKVIQAPPKGEPNAINVGLQAATGDILTWLDSDDTYAQGCLSAVNDHFSNNPNTLWAYGRCNIIDEKGRETRSAVTKFKEIFQPRYSHNSLLVLDYIPQPSTFFTREAVELAGLLNEREKLAFDYDYWLRLSKIGKPGYIDRVLASWRSHPGSETARALRQDMKDALRLSKSYSRRKHYLRPFQFGVYVLAMAGYWGMGALK